MITPIHYRGRLRLKTLFKLVSRVCHKIIDVLNRHEYSDDLANLHAKYPSCTIKSINIYETELGDSVAILTGVGLSQVRLGDYTYVANNSSLRNVYTGNFCSIGSNVQIGLWRHPSKTFVSTYPAFYSNSNESCPRIFRSDKVFDDWPLKTLIGDDVWIGSNVIIPGGIKIGTGAIVAAGSVVVKDVLPYAVVGGNPAKFIKYRFSDEQIELLLKSEWWNWPIETILQNLDSFTDVEKFKSVIP